MFDLEQLQTRLQYMTAGARLMPCVDETASDFQGVTRRASGWSSRPAWFCKADRTFRSSSAPDERGMGPALQLSCNR